MHDAAEKPGAGCTVRILKEGPEPLARVCRQTLSGLFQQLRVHTQAEPARVLQGAAEPGQEGEFGEGLPGQAESHSLDIPFRQFPVGVALEQVVDVTEPLEVHVGHGPDELPFVAEVGLDPGSEFVHQVGQGRGSGLVRQPGGHRLAQHGAEAAGFNEARLVGHVLHRVGEGQQLGVLVDGGREQGGGQEARHGGRGHPEDAEAGCRAAVGTGPFVPAARTFAATLVGSHSPGPAPVLAVASRAHTRIPCLTAGRRGFPPQAPATDVPGHDPGA